MRRGEKSERRKEAVAGPRRRDGNRDAGADGVAGYGVFSVEETAASALWKT